MKLTISDPEVKAPKVLVRNNQLYSGKYDVPALDTFSSSDQHSDVKLQEFSEIWGISLSISSKTFQKTTHTEQTDCFSGRLYYMNDIQIRWMGDSFHLNSTSVLKYLCE